MSQITEVRLTIAAIIYAIEIDLKSLIIKHLTPYHDNLNFIGSQETIDNTVKRFKNDNEDIPIDGNIDDVIQYLDFADFFEVILSNKGFFPDSIIKEIKNSLTELEKLIAIRNRVMHTRPLMTSDFSIALSFGKTKQEFSNDVWLTLKSTLDKIEEDPSYVLTLSLSFLKLSNEDAHHNLPIPDFDETGFIGRKKDVADILKLILGNNRVVTIMGDGGVGKSALALKVAYDILDMGSKNPFDIIIWVSAKTTMLTVTGIQEIKNTLVGFGGVIQGISDAFDSSNKEENQLAIILEYMELFDTLLIIDNLETILDEKIREFIRDASQQSKILITSRIGLGELEFRRPLDGLSDQESISLIRGLANLKKSTILNKLKNEKLIEFVKKLYYNPLQLKWFVNSVETGISPSEVLNNKEDLLDFCLSNVYDKLSENAIFIIQTILAARKDLNDAELMYTTELPTLAQRRGLNELFSTTFIKRVMEHTNDDQDFRYSIPEFSKEYILKNHPINSSHIKKITERLRVLNISTLNIERVSSYNEFGTNALTWNNPSEKIIATKLSEALQYSKNGDVDNALKSINEAKSILPNYAEVYRVSGFIKGSYEDLLGAEADYKTGLEIAPENPRLLFYYSGFLLKMNDLINAKIHVEKLIKIRPEAIDPNILYGRVLSTTGKFVEAIDLFNKLLKNRENNKRKIAKISTALIKSYSYWARAIVEKDGDFDLAITKFKQAIEIYENSVDSGNYDEKTTQAFCFVIKTYIKLIPKTHNQENAQGIINLLKKYDEQMSLVQPKEILQKILSNTFGEIREKHQGSILSIPDSSDTDSNFAFIESDGKSIYANKKDFKTSSDFNVIDIGMPVEFELGTNTIGECAINIEVK
ncbi:NB-ARC domain-containing protein [Vicingaceae bacterium]|nr:NB-ARC domain-containing protein [Vicingaceae bacterium]